MVASSVSNSSFFSPYGAMGTGRTGDFFPSPWFDMATASMPDTNRNALEWCEFIWQSHGTFRMGHERIISYFLTDIELGAPDPDKSLGEDEKEKWESVLRDTLGGLEAVQAMDRDRACYGNSFASLVVPFVRFLRCPKCKKAMFKLEEMERSSVFNLEWDGSNFQFVADCPICKHHGPWQIDDQPDDLEKKLKVKIWSPHEMEIKCDIYSGDCTYYWRIPEEYRKAIRGGDMYQIARCPTKVLKAIKHNLNFRFAPDALFHMKEPTLGGIRSRGWGLSRTLTNFRNVFYVQVLRRYNEAIALDYIIPFRVITPDVRPTAGGIGGAEIAEPLRMNDMGDFTAQVRQMLRRRRRNPATWNVIPYPLKYQALGGEASQLVPKDMMDQGNEELLNAIGTPMELYRGTMQLQAAPVSLRLFEATHHSLVYDNNRFLRWLATQVGQILSLAPILATMKRVTHADDFNKMMASLQLMMGQTISQTTGLKGMGIDFKDEQRLIGEEARYQQELQARIQEEMAQSAFGEQIARGQMAPGQAAMGGGMPPGGDPAMGGAGGMPPGGDPAAMGGAGGAGPVTGMLMGPNTPVTPEDMLAQAQSLAQSLLGLPETQKDSELRALKQKNEVLHALVTAQIKQIRQSAQSAGQSLLLGQQPAMAQ